LAAFFVDRLKRRRGSVVAQEKCVILANMSGTIPIHPTLSEAFHEAALRALGHAIHI
jgi:hypothetical protein